MEKHTRFPLQDLPVEHYIAQNSIRNTKSPRKHKRPLSPSRTTPYNPAKRRVLDAEGIPFASGPATTSSALRSVPSPFNGMHTATPTRPSRLGNGRICAAVPSPNAIQTPPYHKGVRNHSPAPSPSPQSTITPSSSHHLSLFCGECPTLTERPSIDRQSWHYPGFDVFQDPLHSPALAADNLADEIQDKEDGPSEGESGKENVPPRRKAKRIPSKKRLSNMKGDLGVSRSGELDYGGRDHFLDCPVPRERTEERDA